MPLALGVVRGLAWRGPGVAGDGVCVPCGGVVVAASGTTVPMPVPSVDWGPAVVVPNGPRPASPSNACGTTRIAWTPP
ncbi:hypothetical protein a10_05921 [Streptomyces acidiscabies]|nr:hypothetical protein a10_05921 [Streptomyces acidiscabies]